MNFIAAIQHATIGYGIRRKAWNNTDAILHLNDKAELHWVPAIHNPEHQAPVKLGHGDICYDLTQSDIAANDWEAI